eukprot:TRINITY_DN1282_c0_g1_i1.p1 TRINITY_DN1282_c0_g1~~TRINITY_DN1282_c0_g1_i1.p1  ORF type:complete len:353 (+),score=127.22 TRINITY_DN1282_c0_g1_i1:264-1322(+)
MSTEVHASKMDKNTRKIRISGDPEIMNLRQLRVELKRMGLSPSGSKAELMKRYRLATGIDDPSIYTDENGAPPELKLFSYPGGRGRSRKDKDSNASASAVDRRAEKSQNSKRKSQLPNQYVVPASKLKYSEWNDDEEDEEYEEFSNGSSDEEEEEQENQKSITSFNDKRKAIGLSDEEIEKRKRARFDNASCAYITREDQQKLGFIDIPLLDEKEMGDWIPSLYDSPLSRRNGPSSEIETIQTENLEEYIADVGQIRFFDHATLELERLQMQKKFDDELSNLQNHIQKMKKELDAKEKIIQTLKSNLLERDQTLAKASNLGISSATTVTPVGINTSTQESLKHSVQPSLSSA